MKTIITSFLSLLFFLPAVLPAQPVISSNEFYAPGDVINLVNCDPAGVSAGGSGAGQTWDFTTISASGGFYTITVQNDTSSVFLTSNLLYLMPAGARQHVKSNHTDVYINGVENTTTGTTIHYNNYHTVMRPFTYATTYLDTYQVNIPATTLHGTGVVTVTGDAYGTLRLPYGTFNNVLRIKRMQSQQDTTGPVIVSTFTVSYQWFDASHTPPLFQLDSVISVMGNVQRAMYLATPAAINSYGAEQDVFTAYLKDHELTVRGDFISGSAYEVTLYNLIGVQVFAKEFVGYNDYERIAIDKAIAPGIYIVRLRSKNDPGSQQIVKVVKQ